MYRLLILMFPMIVHSEDVSEKKIAEISVEDLTNIVRMIVQEAMTNCTVTGEMNGRAKLNLDVEGEVVARLECIFEDEEIVIKEAPIDTSFNEKQLASLTEKVNLIEDELSFIEEISAENQDVTADAITFLDAEVRKLWGHRKGYLDNFKKQTASSDSNTQKLDIVSAKTNDLEDILESIKMNIELAEDLQTEITILTNELKKQKDIIQDNSQALDELDLYKLQNDQKIYDELTKLNLLSSKNELRISRLEFNAEN